MKIGDLVRFAHEQNGGPVHRVASVMADGMVELGDMGGYFAPHLFVAADDIGDIPPHCVRAGNPSPKGDRIIILDAEDYEQWRLRCKQDRDDQDRALADALRDAVNANRLLAAVRKVRDGYADQARFADPEAAAWFREFVRRLDIVCEVKK